MITFFERRPVPVGLVALTIGLAILVAVRVLPGDDAGDGWGYLVLAVLYGVGAGTVMGGLGLLIRNYRDGRRTDLDM